ncbi:MAG: hypothetical protein RIF33_01550 [Cyclobacteriaceae bacterium]
MTTITIAKDLHLTKTEFKDEVELLQHLARISGDYDDPQFQDTIVNEAVLEKMEKAKHSLKANPDSFRSSS